MQQWPEARLRSAWHAHLRRSTAKTARLGQMPLGRADAPKGRAREAAACVSSFAAGVCSDPGQLTGRWRRGPGAPRRQRRPRAACWFRRSGPRCEGRERGAVRCLARSDGAVAARLSVATPSGMRLYTVGRGDAGRFVTSPPVCEAVRAIDPPSKLVDVSLPLERGRLTRSPSRLAGARSESVMAPPLKCDAGSSLSGVPARRPRLSTEFAL